MIHVQVAVDGAAEAAIPLERLEAAARRALEARGVERAELSLTLVDDDAIRELNRRHLGRDRPTDVLAFALWEPGEPVVVGDVYVGFEQALRQAVAERVDPDEELVRLAVHGVLHVTGMDHPEAADERAGTPMYRLQETLVRSIVDQAPERSGKSPP